MTIDEAIEIFEADTSETILNLSELRSDELAVWLEELRCLRLVRACILIEMLQNRPDEFKLYNIKRMIDDYAGRLNDKNIIGVTEDGEYLTYNGSLYRKSIRKVKGNKWKSREDTVKDYVLKNITVMKV